MNAVFLDTVGLLALWYNADQWHAAAQAAYQQIKARHPFRAQVGALRRTLEQRQEPIVPTEQDWAEAWDAYERGEAGQAGVVDHVSFSIMRRLGLRQAFTNDRHFEAAGFEVLF